MGRPRQRWASGTDQLLVGGRYVVMLTDVDTPPPAKVRDALATIIAAGPHTRVGLEPTTNRLWRYIPSAPVPVHEIPADVAATDCGSVLEFIRRRPGKRHWVEVHVSDRHIAIDADHALGDGAFTIGLFQTIFALARGESSAWMTETDTRLPVLRGLVRTFGGKPRRLRDALNAAHQVKNGPATDAHLDVLDVSDLPIVDWSPSFSASSVTIHPDVHAEVDRWRKDNAPACGMSITWLYIAHLALKAAGFTPGDNVMVAFNCRRYLHDGAHVTGNFGAGFEITLSDRESMGDVGTHVRQVSASALPLAGLGLVSAINQVKPRGAHTSHRSAQVGAPMRMMYTDLGRIAALEDLPWIPGGSPSYTGLLDPSTPASLTMLSNSIRGSRTLAASFHDNVFDRDMVTDAMRRIRDEPLKLLTEEQYS